MKLLLKFLFLALLFAIAMTAYGIYSFQAPGPLAVEKTLYFERGAGFKEMTQRLADEGVIAEAWTLRATAMLSRNYHKFRAGEYNFTPGISPKEVMGKFVRGEQVLHKITIPEGLTTADITKLLEAEPLLAGPVPLELKEGALMPDTYEFLRGDSRERIISRMQQAARDRLQTAWDKRAEGLPFATPQEALTLASIVEKETGKSDERAKIAGVFVNRLKKGMKLQSDPTTAYAVTLADGPMNRSLTYSDLKRDLPHNTYTIAGLPPTPICNPGMAAINAVLHPDATDAIFFVADGTGGHNFAATGKEHEANVVRYRALQKAQ